MKYFFYWLIVFFSMSAFAESPSTANSATGRTVELNFFWSHRCPHCLDARPFIDTLADKYAWLQVNSYDIVDHPDNAAHYAEMAKALNEKANSVPAFIFCDQMQIGFDSPEGLGRMLEDKLIACHQSEKANQDTIELILPLVGKVDYQNFSLPVLTVLIASLDAFNPCAFFVLLFLLSLMTHTHSRTRIAVIGGVFVLFSGIMYFLFMAAWLNFFLWSKEIAIITTLAGLIAVIIGIINTKDYFFFKQGLSLSIPETMKPKLFERMRRLVTAGRWPAMIAATIVLALAANSYELLCTAGLPMVYTRILTLQSLSQEHYYLYLAFYNLIYIVPLFLIVLTYTWTLGSKKLTEQQGRLLKLLSGLMMLGLGGLLLFAPDLLNNMLISVSILVAAIGLTLIFYVSGRLCNRS